MSIFQLMNFNPLMSKAHEQCKTKLLSAFPELSDSEASTYLSLGKYLNHSPQKFFCRFTFNAYFSWLTSRHKRNSQELRAYLNDVGAEINRSLLHLREINNFGWHDTIVTGDEYQQIKFIDEVIHPTYLRLVEAVFTPLLRMPAFFSRVDRSKGTDRLDIYNIVDELKDMMFSETLKCYDHIARNGIAHGGIEYLHNEILYRDKKGNEKTLSCNEMIRLCDDMLDACNALVLAYSIFIRKHQSSGYTLLQQMLIEELREVTLSPYWEITGCVQSRHSNQRQLLIYARTKTADYSKVQFSAISTGILSEFFAPGYDRYFLSFRSKDSWPGWTGFDGKKLRALRVANVTDLNDYSDAIENGLVFYVPKRAMPRLFSKIETLRMITSVVWPDVVRQFREQVGLASTVPRIAKLHCNGLMSVLNGSVYIFDESGEVDKEIVRKACLSVVRSALALARRPCKYYDPCRFLPLGYARVSVYRVDHRCRMLDGYGLGSDLICTIQEKRLGRVQSPDIAGSTIEQLGRFRIAWNKAWLDEQGNEDNN